ncbi:MAG: zinc-binding dehydrogenase, partial [Actinomycetota bacterium]|nr:zinc-binding dehydrogenase [Actinomycetota bacterium]
NEARGAAAESLGATVVAEASRLGHALEAPVDVVFEAAGVTGAPAAGVEAVRPGGQVVLLGVVGPGRTLPMPGLLWLLKEVDVLTSVAYTTEEFGVAVAQVASGAVDAVVARSQVRPLDDADRSFDELAGPNAPVKVLLAPRP